MKNQRVTERCQTNTVQFERKRSAYGNNLNRYIRGSSESVYLEEKKLALVFECDCAKRFPKDGLQ